MERFKAVATVSMFGGVVELARDQAKVREQSLRHLEDDFYEVVGPIQFKAGEIIGYKGPLYKSLEQLFLSVVKGSEAEDQETDSTPKPKTRKRG